MKASKPLFGFLMLCSAGTNAGCAELEARRDARDANRLYREGNFDAAIQKYEAAAKVLSDLPAVALNKGLACRQLLIPGAKTPENERAVRCALESFAHLKRLSPTDPRADQLYVQTLFDAEHYESLVRLYEQQIKADAHDLAAINGLIQVYSRSERWDDALRWMLRRAAIQSTDAGAQYAVGVFIWNRLFQKGGAGEKASFDPRSESAVPPEFGEEDIRGQERLRLADLGIEYLEKAWALRPKYRDAAVYLNLLHRQRSFALFDRPADFQSAVERADNWQRTAAGISPSP